VEPREARALEGGALVTAATSALAAPLTFPPHYGPSRFDFDLAQRLERHAAVPSRETINTPAFHLDRARAMLDQIASAIERGDRAAAIEEASRLELAALVLRRKLELRIFKVGG